MLMVKPTAYMKKNVAMTDGRQRQRGDRRRAPVAHEHEHHEDGHDAAEDDVHAHVFDVLDDAFRVGVHRLDLQLREAWRGLDERRIDLALHVDRVGAGLLAHRERHRVGAVEARRRHAIFEAVDHLADVLHAHRRSAGGSQDDVLDLRGGLVLALRAQRNRLAVAPDLPTGHVQVVGGEFRGDFRERKIQRFETARIEVDLQLADFAAVHFNGSDAVDLAEERLEVVFNHAADAIRLQAGRADRVRRNRQRRHVETLDGRILDLLRQPLADRRRLSHALRGRGLRIDLEAQLDADAREAFGRRRDDALHAVDAGDGVFDRARDQRLDFFRTRARIDHRDVDEGEVDLREEIDAEASKGHDAQHHEADDDHRREDGSLN
jgi:hypothetical protein